MKNSYNKYSFALIGQGYKINVQIFAKANGIEEVLPMILFNVFDENKFEFVQFGS